MIPIHWAETGAEWYLFSPIALSATIFVAFTLGAIVGRLWSRKRHPRKTYRYVGWQV